MAIKEQKEVLLGLYGGGKGKGNADFANMTEEQKMQVRKDLGLYYTEITTEDNTTDILFFNPNNVIEVDFDDNETVMFSKIADDLPQVVNPNTEDYFDVEDYKWGFLVEEDNVTDWYDNSGYGMGLNSTQDDQGNIYYYYDNLYFIPTVAYFGADNIKLEKGLYITYFGLNSRLCFAVRLIDIRTGGGPA